MSYKKGRIKRCNIVILTAVLYGCATWSLTLTKNIQRRPSMDIGIKRGRNNTRLDIAA
jgi:hypothetical protein